MGEDLGGRGQATTTADGRWATWRRDAAELVFSLHVVHRRDAKAGKGGEGGLKE